MLHLVLPRKGSVHLLAIDEAHCISSWGDWAELGSTTSGLEGPRRARAGPAADQV